MVERKVRVFDREGSDNVPVTVIDRERGYVVRYRQLPNLELLASDPRFKLIRDYSVNQPIALASVGQKLDPFRNHGSARPVSIILLTAMKLIQSGPYIVWCYHHLHNTLASMEKLYFDPDYEQPLFGGGYWLVAISRH